MYFECFYAQLIEVFPGKCRRNNYSRMQNVLFVVDVRRSETSSVKLPTVQELSTAELAPECVQAIEKIIIMETLLMRCGSKQMIGEITIAWIESPG